CLTPRLLRRAAPSAPLQPGAERPDRAEGGARRDELRRARALEAQRALLGLDGGDPLANQRLVEADERRPVAERALSTRRDLDRRRRVEDVRDRPRVGEPVRERADRVLGAEAEGPVPTTLVQRPRCEWPATVLQPEIIEAESDPDRRKRRPTAEEADVRP